MSVQSGAVLRYAEASEVPDLAEFDKFIPVSQPESAG